MGKNSLKPLGRGIAAIVLLAAIGVSRDARAHDLPFDEVTGEPHRHLMDWNVLGETGVMVLDAIRDAIEFPATALVSPAGAIGSATVTVRGNYRYIDGNGLPNHATGRFPNSGNPNSIRPQSYHYRVPANPRKTGRFTALGRQPFGVALNGVPFDPGTAEFFRRDPRSMWREEAITANGRKRLGLDGNNAHVQPNGAYHYHGIPTGLIATLGGSKLIGYAADGFPIYYTGARSGYRLKRGSRPSGPDSPGGRYDGTYGADYEYVGGALDRCNGATGKTKEYPDGTYYYVVTAGFPFYPRCFAGTPDSSFARGPGGQGLGRPPAGRRRPPPGRRPPPPGRFRPRG